MWNTWKKSMAVFAALLLSAALLIVLFWYAYISPCLPTSETRTLLNSKLSIGDSRTKIETVLKNLSSDTDLHIGYDEYSNSYSGTMWDKQRCGPYRAMSIDIYLDEAGRLSGIEVIETLTMI